MIATATKATPVTVIDTSILAAVQAQREMIERKVRMDKAIKGGIRYLVMYTYEMPDMFRWWSKAYSLETLHETHAVVAYIDSDGSAEDENTLDDIYWSMQGENWSPNGEARDMIEDAGVHHTSMSVGDVIYDTKLGIAWECGNYGWHIILPAYVRRNLK